MLTFLTCAVSPTPIQFIARVTFTSEKSWDILTTSIDADACKGTFVYICEKDREKRNQLREVTGSRDYVGKVASRGGHLAVHVITATVSSFQ